MALLLQLASFLVKPNSPENSEKAEQTNLSKEITVQIKQTKIKAELASTQEQITQGLSYRESLAKNKGMYFMFSNTGFYTFWMKGMKFPLDIIWIDRGQVVGIEKFAPVPEGDKVASFRSPTQVTNVLEVNAGVAEANDWQIGDRVEITD